MHVLFERPFTYKLIADDHIHISNDFDTVWRAYVDAVNANAYRVELMGTDGTYCLDLDGQSVIFVQ